jgi:hypothetical protein
MINSVKLGQLLLCSHRLRLKGLNVSIKWRGLRVTHFKGANTSSYSYCDVQLLRQTNSDVTLIVRSTRKNRLSLYAMLNVCCLLACIYKEKGKWDIHINNNDLEWFLYPNSVALNVVVEWLALLLCICHVLGSNLSLKTGYIDWLSWDSSVPPIKCGNSALN